MLPLLSAEEIADLHAGDTVGLELSSADGAASRWSTCLACSTWTRRCARVSARGPRAHRRHLLHRRRDGRLRGRRRRPRG
ncbi:MAG: hypothetical protein IPN17_36165 [Deltaproteobacteria bacterium]|nr:hypothetical protein [Deltaproteobacteria bacterium]